MIFITTLTAVAIMLLYAVPGFLLIKTKLVKPENITSFAKVLLYVCQPCLTFYSFGKAECSAGLLIDLGIFFAFAFISQLLLLLLFYAIYRKKSVENAGYRVYNVASVLGNCGFFGVPVSEMLFADKPNVALYCMVFTLAMNILSWTVVMAIVSRDKKYIKVSKMFLNPAVISFAVAFILFVCSVQLPDRLFDAVSLVGRFSTVLCMLIMGMRLGCAKSREVFGSPMLYLTVFVKQMAVPLFIFAALYFLPIDIFMKQLGFLLFCCPIASNVQSFSEMCGHGQETAAGGVLLGSLMCILTMPVMTLLIG